MVSTLQKFLKILLGSSQFSGYHSASANCPCSLWTEPPNHGPCDPRSGQRVQLPIGWPLQMVLGLWPGPQSNAWSTFPASAPSWSTAGGLGTPRRAVSLFLFLPMVREVQTCADSLEFPNSIPRRAANLLAACGRIGVLRRRNRHSHYHKNGVKTGAGAAVLSRR